MMMYLALGILWSWFLSRILRLFWYLLFLSSCKNWKLFKPFFILYILLYSHILYIPCHKLLIFLWILQIISAFHWMKIQNRKLDNMHDRRASGSSDFVATFRCRLRCRLILKYNYSTPSIVSIRVQGLLIYS